MLQVTISHAGNVNKEKNRFVIFEGVKTIERTFELQEVETEPVKIDSVQAALGDMRTRWGHFAEIPSICSISRLVAMSKELMTEAWDPSRYHKPFSSSNGGLLSEILQKHFNSVGGLLSDLC